LSDGDQSLHPNEFNNLMKELTPLVRAIGKQM